MPQPPDFTWGVGSDVYGIYEPAYDACMFAHHYAGLLAHKMADQLTGITRSL